MRLEWKTIDNEADKYGREQSISDVMVVPGGRIYRTRTFKYAERSASAGSSPAVATAVCQTFVPGTE